MNKHSRRGFTLMETLLAIAVVAVLLTSFLAVFGPATSGIRRAISVQDADRLASALEHELATLREDEIPEFETSFEKAFDWISSSTSLSDAIILFNYRGDPSQTLNGSLQPFTGSLGTPGQDYLVQSAVRKLGDDSDLEEFLSAVEGRSFAVRMVQLVTSEDGSQEPSTGGGIVNLDGSSVSDADSYEEAAIAFQAEFYILPANNFTYLNGPLAQGGDDFSGTLGNPIFTRNMAVRR